MRALAEGSCLNRLASWAVAIWSATSRRSVTGRRTSISTPTDRSFATAIKPWRPECDRLNLRFLVGVERKGFPEVVFSNSRHRGLVRNWSARIRRTAQYASKDRTRSRGRSKRAARARSLLDSAHTSPLAQSRFTDQTSKSNLRKCYQSVHRELRPHGQSPDVLYASGSYTVANQLIGIEPARTRIVIEGHCDTSRETLRILARLPLIRSVRNLCSQSTTYLLRDPQKTRAPTTNELGDTPFSTRAKMRATTSPFNKGYLNG
jgi:hypothetical protein